MVTSLLMIGTEPMESSGIEAEVGRAATAAEALSSLSRRAWDVVLVGNVPDATCDALVGNLARRYPSIPVLVLDDRISEALRGTVWEVVRPDAPRALGGVVRRAAEVARLRREVDRLGKEHEDGLPRGDVAQTFERGSIREMERLMIMARLDRLHQNRTHSAVSLDISVRTLRNKLREYRESAGVDVSPGEAR